MITNILAKLIDAYYFLIDQVAIELTPNRRFKAPTKTDKAYDQGFLCGYGACLDLLSRSLPPDSRSIFHYPSREQVEEILKKAEKASSK